MSAQYDFDNHKYNLIRDAKQRATIRKLLDVKEEWYIRESDYKHHYEIRICSHTHDDDVELILTGNFTREQAMRVAEEVCAQLNKAESDAAKEHSNEAGI